RGKRFRLPRIQAWRDSSVILRHALCYYYEETEAIAATAGGRHMTPTENSSDSTHFGFREVRREEKAGLVRGVFDSVAGSYDLMNDLMSAGVHRLWISAMIDWLMPQKGQHLPDVARSEERRVGGVRGY